MNDDHIPLPGEVIYASNYRLQVAIQAVRIYGRNAETMCEVYDAKWARLNLRGAYRNSVRERRKALDNHLKTEASAVYLWRLSNAKKSGNVALINRKLTTVTKPDRVTLVNCPICNGTGWQEVVPGQIHACDCKRDSIASRNANL